MRYLIYLAIFFLVEFEHINCSDPTRNECGCYKKGIIGGCLNVDGTDFCQCKPGYDGYLCDRCADRHEDTGTAGEPECSCIEVGADYRGNDLFSRGGIPTWQDCQRLCKDTIDCDLFMHRDKTCWIKSPNFKKNQGGEFQGIISGPKFCPGSHTECWKKDTDYAGKDIGEVTPQPSVKACQESCQLAPDCQFFMYDSINKFGRGKACYHKSLADNVAVNDKTTGFVVGPKFCPSADFDGCGCYKKGSLGSCQLYNGIHYCECKPGYTGRSCDKCDDHHKSTGTVENPVCSCYQNDIAFDSYEEYVGTQDTAEKCQAQCVDDDECYRFEYSLRNKNCWKYGPNYHFIEKQQIIENDGEQGNEVPDDYTGVSSAPKFCTGYPFDPCIRENVYFDLPIIKNMTASSALDCQLECRLTDTCEFIAFDKDGRFKSVSNGCYLQSLIAEATTQRLNKIVGPRVCHQPTTSPNNNAA